MKQRCIVKLTVLVQANKGAGANFDEVACQLYIDFPTGYGPL
jgi:hypothetical protein